MNFKKVFSFSYCFRALFSNPKTDPTKLFDLVNDLKNEAIQNKETIETMKKLHLEELNKFDALNELVSKLKSKQRKVKRVSLSPDIKPNGYSVDPNVLLDVAVIVLTGVCAH